MRSSSVAVVVLASIVGALSPSRPFLLLSTHKSSVSMSLPQYATQSSVFHLTKKYLSACPTKQYVIFNQADLRSSDIVDDDTIPNLRRLVQSSQWSEKLDIGEVHGGTIDGDALAEHIRVSCPGAIVETRYLHSLCNAEVRRKVLADNDFLLAESLAGLGNAKSVTLIYYGGEIDPARESEPRELQYVAQFRDDGSHIDLRRQLGGLRPPASPSMSADDENWPAPPNTTDWTWFQRNSWLTAPQVVIFITLSFFGLIMVYAMMGVTSIQVPYDSFNSDYVASYTTNEKKKPH